MAVIKQAAIIGGGVIGAGWISRLIENGIDVSVYDPAADAAEKVEACSEKQSLRLQQTNQRSTLQRRQRDVLR